jgi:hypothetical protein
MLVSASSPVGRARLSGGEGGVCVALGCFVLLLQIYFLQDGRQNSCTEDAVVMVFVISAWEGILGGGPLYPPCCLMLLRKAHRAVTVVRCRALLQIAIHM